MIVKPQNGDIVKFDIWRNNDLITVLGKVIASIQPYDVEIEYDGTIYVRYWAGLIPATKEEEVLWRLEQ